MSDQRIRIFASALLTGTLMLDVVVAEIHWLIPATVQQSDANFIRNPGGNGAALVRLSEEDGEKCDMIFIGASNVEFWNTEGQKVWDQYYAPRHALNIGVAGDSTQDLLWRLHHANLTKIHPRAAVIFVGLNNFTDTPRDIAAGIKAVVEQTLKTFPAVKVLLVSLTPNSRNNTIVLRTNVILRNFANNKTIYYIDLYSHLPRQGDNWKGLKSDHLHLTAEGYGIWAEQMEDTLQHILTPVQDTAAKSFSKVTQ